MNHKHTDIMTSNVLSKLASVSVFDSQWITITWHKQLISVYFENNRNSFDSFRVPVVALCCTCWYDEHWTHWSVTHSADEIINSLIWLFAYYRFSHGSMGHGYRPMWPIQICCPIWPIINSTPDKEGCDRMCYTCRPSSLWIHQVLRGVSKI